MNSIRTVLCFSFALLLTLAIGCGGSEEPPPSDTNNSDTHQSDAGGDDSDDSVDGTDDTSGDSGTCTTDVCCDADGWCCQRGTSVCWQQADAGNDTTDAGSETDAGDDTCTTDEQCAEDFLCDLGTNECYPACYGNDGCDDGFLCDLSDWRCYDETLLDPFRLLEGDWQVIEGPRHVNDLFPLTLTGWDEVNEVAFGKGLPPFDSSCEFMKFWYFDLELKGSGDTSNCGGESSSETRNFQFNEETQTMSFQVFYPDSGSEDTWSLQLE